MHCHFSLITLFPDFGALCKFPILYNTILFLKVVWHDGEREIPNSWHWRVEHDNGTGSVQSEINIELSRLNLGLPLICKVNSSALDAPISKKIHINMEVAPNLLIMERPHDR